MTNAPLTPTEIHEYINTHPNKGEALLLYDTLVVWFFRTRKDHEYKEKVELNRAIKALAEYATK